MGPDKRTGENRFSYPVFLLPFLSSKKRRRKQVEQTKQSLTEGGVYRTLLIFAVPFLIANLIQSLYGAVDMAVVGWFSDAAGISAVSTGTQVMQIVTSLVSGLTMGGTILIAQYYGAGKTQDAVETIGTMLTLSLIAAVIFTGAMLLATDPILRALQTPAEAFSRAHDYVVIASCGILFIFGYNAISAMLRALGDSKSPLIFITIACICNVVLDLLFVGGFGMGPAGAALATILSQGVSLLCAIFYLRKRSFLFDFKLRSFRITKNKMMRLIGLGLPVSFQETMVNLSFLFITAIVNNLGVITSAAVGVAGKFESFAMLPAAAFSGAIASIAAQNMGAGQPKRAKDSLKASILLAFIASLFFFVWVQVAPHTVMALFKADEAVSLAGAQYMRSFSYDFMLVAFVFSLNGFFNGCGCTKFTMINGVASTILIRVPLAYLLSITIPDSLVGIGMAAPIASAASIVAGLWYLRTNRWQKTMVLE